MSASITEAVVVNAGDNRRANIKRFGKKQLHAYEWINFADIADWCSKEAGSIIPDEQKRAAAFDTLARDLLAGDFEEGKKSWVLYLHPKSRKRWMTRRRLNDAIDGSWDAHRGRRTTQSSGTH